MYISRRDFNCLFLYQIDQVLVETVCTNLKVCLLPVKVVPYKKENSHFVKP